MQTYTYENIVTQPNLDGIHSDVAASDMTDKSIQCCTWFGDRQELEVVFENALNTSDKATLDDIVAANE